VAALLAAIALHATTAGAQALEDFSICTDAADGGALVQMDPWGFGNGVWLVEGWLYHPAHTHDRALRVDGLQRWSTLGGDCTLFPSASFFVASPSGPGTATWHVPPADISETLSEVRDGGCCGMLVEIRVTNVDTRPHSYEWRVYHDTAFGPAPPGGDCYDISAPQPTVDGGPIEVRGVTYANEVDLLALGADDCEGQVRMFSAEDGTLRASYEMLGPNLPVVMEFLRWNDGAEPCTTWSGLVDGNMNLPPSGCSDNSLLFIWRFPAGGGMLQPGESALASYRVGWGCAWPCAGCASPQLGAGRASDVDDCNVGIELTWDAAAFPAPGNGVYHVYRSEIGFADARAQPPTTPPGGITLTRFVDTMTPPGASAFYVVQAESLDYPDCGAGPVVGGSTDELELGPVAEAADLVPPAGVVGAALRATGKTESTVDFEWRLAPLPAPGETCVVLRSDDRPDTGFIVHAQVAGQQWTDPDAPPRYSPTHCWYYDVRIADDCLNLSAD
jgi:hypothetical protein